MNNQLVYTQSAVNGALIGVALAFVVLLMATWLPLVALFSTLCIVCTLVSVIGFMVMLGWQLGSIESILISITAGFSVDYVVHLAHAMVQKDTDVDERIRESFREMGVSVFSGMFTSVGASIFLFMCQIQFFFKFGCFLCGTIAFSWLFANFFFPTLVKTFGIGPPMPCRNPFTSAEPTEMVPHEVPAASNSLEIVKQEAPEKESAM